MEHDTQDLCIKCVGCGKDLSPSDCILGDDGVYCQVCWENKLGLQ